MCLTVRMRPVPISKRAKHRPLKPVDGTPHAVSICDGAYEISPGRTCGCALLADEADWNEPTWRMRPEMRAPLARTVEAVIRRLGNEGVFEALWIGEPHNEEQILSPEQLLTVIGEGRVRTHTRYRITPGAAA